MNHISSIAKALNAHHLDAILITSPPGEYYAIGMRGEGYLIVTPTQAHYSTDGRYLEAAQEQITQAEVVCTSLDQGHLALAAQFIGQHGLQRVGFESDRVHVDQLQKWKEALPCQLIPAPQLLSQLRASKDPQELEFMRQAQSIVDDTFQAILNFIRPGLTEQEIAARLVYEMMVRGARKVSFDPIVAAGPNGSRPHAIPGQRTIESGMFLTMDFGCIWEGYCSDMTRTVAVGQPTQEMEQVYDTVLQAQRCGIAAARAGIPGSAIDQAARSVIEDAGYGPYFSHNFGHSLGIEIHEPPYASPRSDTIMPVGAVISAEPGIYLPGRFGVRIEDALILKEDGCEIITQSPKDLIVL